MVLFLAALKDEIRLILNEMEVTERVFLRPATIIKGIYSGREILLARTGVGVKAMRRAAEFCINEYKPQICVNVGYCGALTPNLALADMVIADNVVDEADETSYTPVSNENIINACKGHNVFTGTMLTVGRVISTPHEKAYLGTKFGAIAVDMESAGLAKAIGSAGMPFAVVRAVLDPMDMHLPRFDGLVSEAGTTSVLGLANAVLNHPSEILTLPQIEFCASKARKALAAFMDVFIKDGVVI